MTPTRATNNESERGLRSSLEIMGCVSANLSRPPSSMPDFDFAAIHNDSPLPPESQVTEHSPRPGQAAAGKRRFVQLILSASLLMFSLLSITAVGTVMTVLYQVGKPVPVGYSVFLIVSIATLVFSLAGLGHVLYGSPKLLTQTRLPSLPSIHCWTPSWPSFRWPKIPFPTIRRQSGAQSPSHLPDPKQFELDDLERQPRRPPTPYPGPARPVPIITRQSSLRDSRFQSLPLGFPVPPSSRLTRISNRISGLSRVSAPISVSPFTVSPLSESPPTPPPKGNTVVRFQSQERLLSPVVSRRHLTQSENRASILTELCDAVQVSNPVDDEPSAAAEGYSPLAMTSSPAAPKPTYQIGLASPSRAEDHEG